MHLGAVLMIEDHAMVRQGIRLLLEQQLPDCRALEASSFAEAKRILEGKPALDWILLDLGLPDRVGVDALSELRAAHPELPVVILSASEDRALVLECIHRGASGFIGKSAPAGVLGEALRLIVAGGVYLPPSLFGQAAVPAERSESVLSNRRDELARRGLTPRQIEVLELLVQGLSNRVIASRLNLAESTVKTHVAAGLRALNVKNRTQAVFALATWGSGPGRAPRSPHE
jgi:DNA-binding NarL/FixJ family response regulator